MKSFYLAACMVAISATVWAQDGQRVALPDDYRNTFAKKDFNTCFACHLPLGDAKDFVFDNAWSGLK